MFDLGGRVLVLAAHTDDEFGCAGTIARLVEDGREVHLATFSSAEESVPDGFDRDVLKREARDATEVLGIPPERFRLYDYRVRYFPSRRQEILEDLILLRAEIDPQIVFLPSTTDMHQDHGVIAQEGLRAFKHISVFGYELPMNNMTFDNSCYVALEPRHVERKLAHAAAYRSQGHRPYLQPERVRALATVRGLQMNADAAEAFQVLRMMVR
jgi:LmbE family N-acetylglucosaminyl deacetylase